MVVLIHHGGQCDVVEWFGHALLEGGQAVFERVGIAGCKGDGVQHGHGRVDVGLLGQIADSQTAAMGDSAG